MRTAIRFAGLVAVLVLLTGCASAKLRLDLAIYKEDPRAGALLSPEQVDAMIKDLDTIVADASVYADSRKTLGATVVDVIADFSTLRQQVREGAKFDPEKAQEDQKLFRDYVPAFDQAIDARLAAVNARTAEAKKALAQYRRLLQPTEQLAKTESTAANAKKGEAAPLSLQKQNEIRAAQLTAHSAIELVVVAVQQLTGNLGTDLEQVIRDDRQAWAGVMKPEAFDSPEVKKRVEQLAVKLRGLQTTITDIEARGNKIGKGVEERFAGTLAALDPDKPAGLSKTVEAIATAVTAIPDSLQFSNGGTQAISDITRRTALLSSQIERLQNPADPVWRIVTDPANAAKWNESFSKTYFYAEGNTSVTIVRDSPMDFRIQQGANNPAALVQAQLQVSRAIGSAALTVAGAAAGVNLAAFGQQAQAPETQKEPAESDAEKLARRRATVQEERALRAGAVRGLVISLRNFRGQLSDPNLGNTVGAAKPITDNIVDMLRGYQKVFQTDSGSQASKP
jgi:hypothetical protein